MRLCSARGKVSPACDNCYAEGWAKRTGYPGLWVGDEPRRTSNVNWREPIKWNRKAEAAMRKAKALERQGIKK